MEIGIDGVRVGRIHTIILAHKGKKNFIKRKALLYQKNLFVFLLAQVFFFTKRKSIATIKA